jgi:hypothetical protein
MTLQFLFARFSTANRMGWRGAHVFDLKENPKANRAYAWSSPIEGSDKRRFFAVLHLGAIKSPRMRFGPRLCRKRKEGVLFNYAKHWAIW